MIPSDPADNLSLTKRAVYEIRTLKARVAELERAQKEPLALVGMGLRFPGGASTPEAFWDLLSHGVDAVGEVPPSRWAIDRYFDPDPDRPGKMSTRYGAFLEDPAQFDADFFGISPREAVSLDPQHRLALEVAWEAIENAGYNPLKLAGSPSGVFLAAGNGDYGRMVFGRLDRIDAYSSLGNVFSVMSGRISYLLGLHGPSLVVDTACSGSLVALHLACQSLRARECDFALAGGVNLILSPELHVNFSKARMMSPEGKCRSFDARADGYVRGEGCGIVVLKRLSDAMADGDRILAVIHSSAVNQDGHSSGVTAPNGAAQEALIRKALADAEIRPDEIDYVETHGTGTPLGDPIEARALAATVGSGRTTANPLIVGAVKTNVGHLEAAAGIAGLIKVVLALGHEQIPPNLHFEQLNPYIEWGSAVQVADKTRSWARGARRRLAGVSSFGFSGTNAHVVVGEAPVEEAPKREFERPLQLLTLSARTAAALEQQRSSFRKALSHSVSQLGDICFTANAGRAAFAHREAYIGGDIRRIMDKPTAQGVRTETTEVVFLFSGQGTQYPGMGRELYETQPVFRQTMDRCAGFLKGELEHPLLDLLWGSSSQFLDQTSFAQPALFALEYSLSELWRSWGVRPAAVLGHSLGEYVAATVAGVCGLEDGLKLAALRGKLMQAVSGRGAMVAANTSEEQARAALRGLEGRVTLAAINGPLNVTIAGFDRDVELAAEHLRNEGVRVKRLSVSHGFHSPQMDPMVDAFLDAVNRVRWQVPEVQLISSVTGLALEPGQMEEQDYWRRQLRQPVQFRRAIESLHGYGYRSFVEIGPGATLAGLGRACLADPDALWVPSLRKDRGEWTQMLESLATLFVRGAEVDWDGFDKPYQRHRVALPTYPFERQRYWIEIAAEKPALPNAGSQWDSIAGAARLQASQARLDLNVAGYVEKWAALNALALGYITVALHQIGFFQTPGERLSAQSAVERFGIRSIYERLLHRWLNRLAEQGLINRQNEDFIALRPLGLISLQPLRERAERSFSDNRVLLDYTIRCGEIIAEVITGKREALETLVPDGTLDALEVLYERDPVGIYANSISRAALEAFVRVRAGEVVRVLEIGAGVGATTSSLLPVLPRERTVYHFTDLSESFFKYAENRFRDYPFIRYGRLDIERESHAQGYPHGSVDVVTATNVLHATRDLRATVKNAASLLAPGGLLILSETAEPFCWLDATAALISGWQRYDDGLREDQPLLPATVWAKLLEEAGFERIISVPDESSPAAVLGRCLLIAQMPEGAARSAEEFIPAGEVALSRPPRVEFDAENSLAAILQAPVDERHRMLIEFVRGQIAAILRFDSPDQVAPDRRLLEMGMDSLLALETRSCLSLALGLAKPLPATLVYDHPTVEALTRYIERDVLLLEPDEAPESAPAALAKRALELESLDDSAVEALLMERLRSV